MTRRIPFKSILLIILLAAPMAWLMLAKEGQRQTDLLLLGLRGDPELPIEFDRITPSLTEATLKQELPEIAFDCGKHVSPFGDRICHSPIAAFNGNPSRYATFFLADGRLRAIKIGFRHGWHTRIVGQLTTKLGGPTPFKQGPGPDLLRWHAGGGYVLMPQTAADDDKDPALFWLADD